MGTLVIHDLPDDYYERYRSRVRDVTTVSVLAAARAHLHPDQLRVVVVGDSTSIAEQVATAMGMAAEVMTPEAEDQAV